MLRIEVIAEAGNILGTKAGQQAGAVVGVIGSPILQAVRRVGAGHGGDGKTQMGFERSEVGVEVFKPGE